MNQFDTGKLRELVKYFDFTKDASELDSIEDAIGKLKLSISNQISENNKEEITSSQEVFVNREVPSYNITETGERKVIPFNRKALLKKKNKATLSSIKNIAKAMNDYGCFVHNINQGIFIPKSVNNVSFSNISDKKTKKRKS